MKPSDYTKMKRDPSTYIEAMCWDKVVAFFKDEEKARVWFATSNPLLGEISPNEMMMLGRHQKLIDFINNSLEGNRP
jgi:uncharacterized protein (DUF2384 family)